MKKILILLSILFIPAGCVNIQNTSIENIVSEVQKSKLKNTNQIRTGYKYYLPSDLSVIEINEFNEIIITKDFKYYLYVDLVSYYNKIKTKYETKASAYFSKDITYNDKSGYLEINVKDDKYLIEIIYNYAKIELIVDKDNVNEVIVNALIILSTIKYNDDIIKNMIDGNSLSFGEEELKIFDINQNETNYLDYVDMYDVYEGDDALPDLDNVKKGA